VATSDRILNLFVTSRLPFDEQRRELLEVGIDPQAVEKAYAEARNLARGRRWMYPPPMIGNAEADADSWYLGADSVTDAKFWPVLKRYLSEDKKWPDATVDSIHKASDRIVAWLQSPAAAQIKTRGLVVGYVQSGKTANFTAVISKAADAGYRFFIVLSGTKNALRSQTQRRLNTELIDLNRQFWYSPTTVERDFLVNSDIGNATFFLRERRDDRILCVVKKNATILKRLTNWLKSASPEVLRECPFLIIDDEADEASVNTARQTSSGDPEDADRTKINLRLVELLTLLPKAAYVGYTATPFANVLIDPRYENDLYPRDFIVSLPKSEGHFGTEDIFGRERLLQDDTDEEFQGLDVVRSIPVSEVGSLKPASRSNLNFEFDVTSSLQDAMYYFWMATAARQVRGQNDAHSTMLVHTSERIPAHRASCTKIDSYRRSLLRKLWSAQADENMDRFAELWEAELNRVSPQEGQAQLAPVSFEQIRPLLLSIIEGTVVIADNSQSMERLSYEGTGRIQIVVGGNTLARGLTLEGLIVSYFVRSAGAYDTLLQMGRWFGYRRGYSDLPRMWMTDELRGQFADMATVEAEIRQDIERYARERIKPSDFGVRIREHPNLSITAPMKMQNAVRAKVSFARAKHQTVLFEHKNADWLNGNLAATSKLVTRLVQDKGNAQFVKGHQVFFQVPVQYVLEYLSEYRFHTASSPVNAKLLSGYIKNQNQFGALRDWNVVVRGVKGAGKTERGRIRLGPLDVPLLERARRPVPSDYANIGALMSKGDIGLDLVDLESTSGLKEDGIIDMREERMSGLGLLVIYPISKDSQVGSSAKSSSQNRVPLGAAADVIGLGFVFPPAAPNSDSAQAYVTIDPMLLFGGDVEEVELDDTEA
jgi:hypothetical protein